MKEKNLSVTILSLAALCLYLGARQQATYSPIEAFKAPQPADNPATGINAGASCLMRYLTAGELISEGDSDSWLLSPAASSAPGHKPVRATISADKVWEASDEYKIAFSMPDEVFLDSYDFAAKIYYPVAVKAGDTGIIIAIVSSDNGYVYCAYSEFIAGEDLDIAHVKDDRRIIHSEDLVWIQDNNQLAVNLYTSPGVSEDYQIKHDDAYYVLSVNLTGSR